jgi:hypothetical protein
MLSTGTVPLKLRHDISQCDILQMLRSPQPIPVEQIHIALVQALQQGNANFLTMALAAAENSSVDVDVPCVLVAFSRCSGKLLNKYVTPLPRDDDSEDDSEDGRQDTQHTHIPEDAAQLAQDVRVDDVLRMLLLHHARPSVEGVVVGYSPSCWLEQTFAKGWPQMGGTSRAVMSWDENFAGSSFHRVMHGSLVAHCIFSMLSGCEKGECELPPLQRVCRSWRNNIAALFAGDMVMWKKSVLTEREEQEERARRALASMNVYCHSSRHHGIMGAGSDDGYNDDHRNPFY